MFYVYVSLDYASNAPSLYGCRQSTNQAIEFSEYTITKYLVVSNIIETYKLTKKFFMISPFEKVSLKVIDSTVNYSHSEELLEITIDSRLIFHDNIMSLCYKANQNFSVLVRITKYLTRCPQKLSSISLKRHSLTTVL